VNKVCTSDVYMHEVFDFCFLKIDFLCNMLSLSSVMIKTKVITLHQILSISILESYVKV
jgi:hypothetical protein